MNTFKIVVVGDARSGKTAFIKRHITGEFEEEYNPTTGATIHPLVFYTNHGTVTFNIWEWGGSQYNYECYKGAYGAILMFDSTNYDPNDSIRDWILSLRSIAGDIPITICGNKVDSRCIHNFIAIASLLSPTVKYYDISVKSNYNLEKPFLHLARKVTKQENLCFTETQPPKTPKTNVLYFTETQPPKTPKTNVLCFTETQPPKTKVTPPKSPCSNKKVSWMRLPGKGAVKVTHKFYDEEEVMDSVDKK